MPTHVHFHDLDTWDFVPKHKGKGPGGGQFTSGPGGGGQAVSGSKGKTAKSGGTRLMKHAQQKQQRHQPQTRSISHHVLRAARSSAAQQVAEAVKHHATALGKEAFGGPGGGDDDALLKAMSKPGVNVSIGKELAQNSGRWIKDMAKDNAQVYWHCATALYTLARHGPQGIQEHHKAAAKAFARKMVIKALIFGATGGAGLVPGVGAAAEHAIGEVSNWVFGRVAEEVVDQAVEDHTLKVTGGVARATGLQRLFQRRKQDHAFRDDAQPGNEEAFKLLSDFTQTLAETMAKMPIDKLVQKYQKQYQQQADSVGKVSGPMFGGLGGNNPVRDEGTSEGAKKGWRLRRRGSKGPQTQVKPSGLRKASEVSQPPERKPPQQLQLRRPAKSRASSQKPHHGAASTAPLTGAPVRGAAEPHRAEHIERKESQQKQKHVPTATTLSSQSRESVKLKGPYYRQIREIGDPFPGTKREREYVTGSHEKAAAQHQENRKELQSLRERHARGEIQPNSKEATRMAHLNREYGHGDPLAPKPKPPWRPPRSGSSTKHGPVRRIDPKTGEYLT